MKSLKLFFSTKAEEIKLFADLLKNPLKRSKIYELQSEKIIIFEVLDLFR